MASDEQQDHEGGPGGAALPVPGSRNRPDTPDTSDTPDSPGEPLVGEATGNRPVIVVSAIALERPAREALAQRLGPGHIVRDIREAGPDADIVLVPPGSAQLLGALRSQFPQARLLATEFTDDSYGAAFGGPISRVLASDIDGYFMAATMDDLARVTQSAGRAVAGALTGGSGSGRGRPVDFLQANRRLLLESGGAPCLFDGDGDGGGEGERDGVTIDLGAWARSLDGVERVLADLVWPLIVQFIRQGVRVTVVGDPPDQWTDRARAAGVRVSPAARRLA
jgi:hypothetical protein